MLLRLRRGRFVVGNRVLARVCFFVAVELCKSIVACRYCRSKKGADPVDVMITEVVKLATSGQAQADGLFDKGDDRPITYPSNCRFATSGPKDLAGLRDPPV